MKIRSQPSPSAADSFLQELARGGRQPLLGNRSGTLRIDVTGGTRVEHRHITVDRGDVSVARKKGPADAVLRVDRGLLDEMVSGRVNATAALLRGELEPEGDLGLLIAFQRLFPGPPQSTLARSHAP